MRYYTPIHFQMPKGYHPNYEDFFLLLLNHTYSHNSMSRFSIKNYDNHNEEIKRITLKFYEWALDHQVNSLRIVIADEFYYDKSLEQRVQILDTLATKFLCKTIIFQNTAYNQKFTGDFYPKYIAVMVQYIAKINTEKLNKQIKLYQNQNCEANKAGKQFFHYRLVQDKESQAMTGYSHNGVVPVLMKTRMPIIFSHEIVKLTPQFFWMGAGHAWIKMRCSFQDFRKAYEDKVLTFDVTY